MIKAPSRLLIALALAAPLGALPAVTFAQDASGAAASPASTPKAQAKAQRKAARKQARAKRNADLKKLEANGYNPAQANDANYPQDIQNAEKKAAGQQPASQ